MQFEVAYQANGFVCRDIVEASDSEAAIAKVTWTLTAPDSKILYARKVKEKEVTAYVPKVGDGATQGVGSDRYPFTIVEVCSERKIVVQPDNAVRTDNNGFSESQTYEYSPMPDAAKIVVTRRKDGCWRRKGEPLTSRQTFALGHREKYQDPSF